ncbi:MAG: chromate transporter [Lachnospiraceae bacterium]
MNDSSHRVPLRSLFFTFLKIGAFTFGGGYAMLPLIQRETSETHHWISEDDLLDVIAIAESTPGPVSINAATFIGYKTHGFSGALCCTLGIILPSFFCILAVSGILQQFQSNPLVEKAFLGVRAGVLALIVKAFYSLLKKTEKNRFTGIVAAGVLILAAFTDLNVPLILLCCACIGFIHLKLTLGKDIL